MDSREELPDNMQKRVLFPYGSYRKIQKAFIAQVGDAVANRQKLLIHAPTGSGKTISVLAPALPYATEHNKRIVFLTSKNTQHIIAVTTLKQIKEKYGLPISAVDLVGRKWMCNEKGVSLLSSNEFNDYCKEMKKKDMCLYHTNVRTSRGLSPVAQKVAKELKDVSPLSVEDVNSICSEADLCPYEMSCILARDARIIIADYNYILNPNIRSSFLKRVQLRLEDLIIIIDEAHNLPDRARKLLSDRVTGFMLEQAAKECKQIHYKETAEAVDYLSRIIFRFVESHIPKGKEEALLQKEELISKIREKVDYMEFIERLHNVGAEILMKKKRSFANSIANFLQAWLGPDEGFVRIMSKEKSLSGKGYFALKYICLDPSLIVRGIADAGHSFICMSGTLTPTDMYRDLLGLGEETLLVEYENPFPKENRLSLIVPVTSTKFTARNPMMYKRIAEHCACLLDAIPGNCAVFFPSYQVRDDVYTVLKNLCEKTMFLETAIMSKSEKVIMLEDFKSYKDKGAVLLCASSGNYGESIDLAGNFLNGVIVVGLPLAKPDLETQEIINYYDRKFEKGWDYGYVLPAIIKTVQNAGRCIRTETDRGAVIFLEERYSWPRYLQCFPKDWNLRITKEPEQIVRNFFSEK